jgi:voltage-gated potassium channel
LVSNYRNVDEWRERWARRFDVAVLVAAALVIPVVVIEQTRTDNSLKTVAGLANWMIWLVFLAEVVFMLSVVPNRKGWLKDNPLDVAIVVLTPPFLPVGLQALRVFRLLRLLRLIRILQAVRRVFSPQGLQWALLVGLLTIFIGGAAFAAMEEGPNPHVHNTWDGIWWAVCTMTTVGYGDIGPVTDSGRVLAIVVMLVGIGVVTMLIGATAERFVAHDVAEVEEDVAEGLESMEAFVMQELRAIQTRLAELEHHLASSSRARGHAR